MISSLTPKIIFEDKDIIVCHKPAGIPTQSSRIGTKDMVSILKNHLVKNTAKKTASREPYLAVIHRLDQPVEGLLVFAKTPAAAKELSRQLTTSGFGKYYRAQALGIFEHNEGTLEDYLVKDGRTNTSRVCEENVPNAKYARLHYKVIHTDTLPSGEPFSDPRTVCTCRTPSARGSEIWHCRMHFTTVDALCLSTGIHTSDNR